MAIVSMMAIVSKSVFEYQLASWGRSSAAPGDVLPFNRYSSASKALEPLHLGGPLFLVTVRPPREELWLVAVLQGLIFRDGGWHGAVNTTPVTDISALRARIKFGSGKGMSQAKGALGMSLQTPRALAAADLALLAAAIGIGGANAPAAEPPASQGGLINLTAHDPDSAAPCLCKRCFDPAIQRAEANGLKLVRGEAISNGRVLRYWMPEELVAQRDAIAQSVRSAMQRNAVARRR